MKQLYSLITSILLITVFTVASAQESPDSGKTPSTLPNDSISKALLKPQKVVTHGSVTVANKTIDYQSMAGTIILKDKKDKPTCSMFYTAYFKDGVKDQAQRPITFLYNGGPGSATLWLHMGSFGPKRIAAADTSRVLPPYKLVNNEYSLLDVSDLVFIDAPGTGFSQIIDKDKGGAGSPENLLGVDQDADAFTQFIMQFLSSFNRWNSPKYLFGESYGTFRSAAVAYKLQVENNVDLNGIILLSQLLSYYNMTDLAESDPGMDLPYQLALPTYAATAWYHHKLPEQPEKLEPFLKEVEQFAMSDYALALSKGVTIDPETTDQIAKRLHQYTGLSEDLIKKANLRVTGPVFSKNLLADEDKVNGRLDSRFVGYSFDPLSKRTVIEPFSASIGSIFISTANNYFRTTLKYGKDQTFHPFGNFITKWDFRHKAPGAHFKMYTNVMPDLAQAMTYNPKMKVMLNMGYFDLGTPYFEGVYEMHHLPMNPALQKNISYAYYESGHMVYMHIPSLKKLHDNVANFILGSY